MTYTNHSGGAQGADMEWENQGWMNNVLTIAYSFQGHSHYSQNPCILSDDDLDEGFAHVVIAAKTLKRPLDRLAPYVKKLLARNWFQVKNSTAIYAVGQFASNELDIVDGGTGWAVQMAVNNGKSVWLFDQPTEDWYLREPGEKRFQLVHEYTPKLTEDFAGIGTRDLNSAGRKAITAVYKETFPHEG